MKSLLNVSFSRVYRVTRACEIRPGWLIKEVVLQLGTTFASSSFLFMLTTLLVPTQTPSLWRLDFWHTAAGHISSCITQVKHMISLIQALELLLLRDVCLTFFFSSFLTFLSILITFLPTKEKLLAVLSKK